MNQTNQPLYFILLGALGFAVFSIQLQHSVIQNVDGTNRNSNAYLGAPKFATNRTADKWNSTSSHMGRSKKNKNASQVFLNSLMQSTLIPLKPDPRVMTNIAKAWTEENGTEQMYLKDDPNLKNVRKGGKCPVTSVQAFAMFVMTLGSGLSGMRVDCIKLFRNTWEAFLFFMLLPKCELVEFHLSAVR